MRAVAIDWPSLNPRQLGVLKSAANRLGLPFEDYRGRLDSGLRWCMWCRDWQPFRHFLRSNRGKPILGNRPYCRGTRRRQVRADARRIWGRLREPMTFYALGKALGEKTDYVKDVGRTLYALGALRRVRRARGYKAVAWVYEAVSEDGKPTEELRRYLTGERLTGGRRVRPKASFAVGLDAWRGVAQPPTAGAEYERRKAA